MGRNHKKGSGAFSTSRSELDLLSYGSEIYQARCSDISPQSGHWVPSHWKWHAGQIPEVQNVFQT
jgi:hypothetical protein